MPVSRLLLVTKHQPAPLGLLRRAPSRQRRYAMPIPRANRRRRALHRLFGGQHLPRGEPLPPASIHPKPHQLRRRLRLSHRQLELRRIRRVPRHEPRQVTPGKRRVLPRDRVQHDRWLRDDTLAVAPPDLHVLGRPFRILTPMLTPHPGRTDLMLRLQLDALLDMRPVIDPNIMTLLSQSLIGQRRPTLPPSPKQRPIIPGDRLLAELGLLPSLQPILRGHYLTHGQHDVRVWL